MILGAAEHGRCDAEAERGVMFAEQKQMHDATHVDAYPDAAMPSNSANTVVTRRSDNSADNL